ncbi:MAG: RNA degradosome polyphosphate kinase [Clostridia bacterium]|nr:RNA degradosome polyphosphate kinase [Clostridia bacterium]
MKSKNSTGKVSKKFINRELSWLEFNERVLEEAYDNNNPLFERLKFASIVSSNLDEFFMVRVASLYDQVMAGFDKPDPSGLTPKEQLDAISLRAHTMIYDQYNCFNRSLMPALKKEKVFILKGKDLTERQKEFVEAYYKKTVYPVLTPMVVDKSRPFPLLLNKSLNIALLLEDKEEKDPIFATIQVPSVLNRLIEIPAEDEKRCFIFLEEIMEMYLDTLFSGHDILAAGCYRITRNADQGIDEEGAEDLLEAIEQFLKKRKWGVVIRLEIESSMDKRLIKILEEELEVPKRGIFEISGPLDLTFLMKLSALAGFDNLRYPHFYPQPSPGFMGEEDVFEAISQGDILVHHPFESFDPVVELVKQAAVDPHVLAIKQTLYRVSGNSPIVEALERAAENGKQVTVLVELKARFDEQNNIIWAKRLEMAGCHVIYGLVGLKTHCKVLLIVRREDDEIKRYVHMGTGNYNDVTARFYTDLGLFTSNPYFGADASALFNMLSGYSNLTRMYKTFIAPISMRNRFMQLIEQETEHARNGKKARIIAKFNSLVDEQIIGALYDASKAGVEIDLIVRGICCLKPGIKGLSENICVKSIVGRLLEHSRIYYFYNDGDALIYLSSADWMGRNLDRRVELLFPLEDKEIREKVKGILDVCLKDTVKARLLKNDGTYSRVDKRGKEIVDSQEYFYKHAVKVAEELNKDYNNEEFKPIMSY